jgi:beta-glucanase (GH16 family)
MKIYKKNRFSRRNFILTSVLNLLKKVSSFKFITYKSLIFVILFLFFIRAQQTYWILQPQLSDEFNYPAGTSIDLNKWYFQTDAHFNGEAQQYTDWQYNVPSGSHLTDYNLRTTGSTIQIVARQHQVGNYRYTSVRINSQCRMAFTYGRIEFRMKPPSATLSGLWPAVWMLGNNINQSPRCPSAGSQGWPGCGEVDLWEYQSSRPNSYITNGFCGSGCGNTVRRDIVTGNQAGVWRIYCAEWDSAQWKYWYRNDGEPFDTVRGLVVKNNADCGCFKRDMFYLINLAIGGTLGNPIQCAFPETLELDYIRTYKRSTNIQTNQNFKNNEILWSYNKNLKSFNFIFNLNKSSHIKITAFDINGRVIENILDKDFSQGNHTIKWIYKIYTNKVGEVFVINGKIGEKKINQKIVLIK